MRRVPNGVAKARSRRLTRFFESLNPHERLMGETIDVWVNTEATPESKYSERHTVGHTKSYVKVLLPFDAELEGCRVTAQVTEVHRWHVVARVLSCRPIVSPPTPAVEEEERKALDQGKTSPALDCACAGSAPAGTGGCCGGSVVSSTCGSSACGGQATAEGGLAGAPITASEAELREGRLVFLGLQVVALSCIAALAWVLHRPLDGF